MGLRRHRHDDEAIAEILGTVALWSEVTRFNIGAQVRRPHRHAARSVEARTGTED